METVTIGEIWALIQKHEFTTAMLVIGTFYILPIIAKSIFSVLGSIVAFFAKIAFNDYVEDKIKCRVSAFLARLLKNDGVTAKDIPHLESDYLFLYKLHLDINESLSIEIPTVQIRVRFWRLVRRVIWLYLRYMGNTAFRDERLQKVYSEELKEIRLENAELHLKLQQEHISEITGSVKAGVNNYNNLQIENLETLLESVNFHVIIDRALFRVYIEKQVYTIENINGYVKNEGDIFNLYINGLYDGQIISFANKNNAPYDYQLVIPKVTVIAPMWSLLTEYIPSLGRIKTVIGEPLGKFVDIHCDFSLVNTMESLMLEWGLRDGLGIYGKEGEQQYLFTAVEGSFKMKGLQNFVVSKFNLKINNHPIGFGAKLDFAKRLNCKANLIENSCAFTMSLDSNSFALPNNLDISLLDGFYLPGTFEISKDLVQVRFDSEGLENTCAVKLSYKGGSVILTRFKGTVDIQAYHILIKELNCLLGAVCVGDSIELELNKAFTLQELEIDLRSKDNNFKDVLRKIVQDVLDGIKSRIKHSSREAVNTFVEGAKQKAEKILRLGTAKEPEEPQVEEKAIKVAEETGNQTWFGKIAAKVKGLFGAKTEE